MKNILKHLGGENLKNFLLFNNFNSKLIRITLQEWASYKKIKTLSDSSTI